MRSKKLQRQLNKSLGCEILDTTIPLLTDWAKSRKSDGEPADIAQILFENFETFLDAIDSSYELLEKNLANAQRSLELSGIELEDRNKALRQTNDSLGRLNATVNAMIDSLNEGFIVFDRDGKCTSISSKRAKYFLGEDPFQKTIWDTFKIPQHEQVFFIDWYNYLFNPRLKFRELASTGPDRLTHEYLQIAIEYHPMFQDGKLSGVIVILRDITAEILSAKRAEKFMYRAEMIAKFYADQKTFMEVIELFNDKISYIKGLCLSPQFNESTKPEILRVLHTLKGCAGSVFLMDLSSACDEMEKHYKDSWIDNLNTSQIIDLLKELIHSLEKTLNDFYQENSQILGINRDIKNSQHKTIDLDSIDDFYSSLKSVGNKKLMEDFSDRFLTTSFEEPLNSFKTMGQTTAKKLGKDIEIKISSDPSLRIYKEVYQGFLNSIVHILNNAIAHGIENTEMRVMKNKNAIGQITIDVKKIFVNGANNFVLTITDDGGGIDPSKVRRKLNEMGIDAKHKEDDEIIYHIFDLGFSTQTKADLLSGRGVGLNVVKEEIERLGGKIEVISKVDQGCTFSMMLPWMRTHDIR